MNGVKMEAKRNLSSLTIVAPFYNEKSTIQVFYDTVCQHLDSLNIPCNFVLVDDGSQDETLQLLNAIADKDQRVTVLSLARNFGHQIALTAGLDYADGEAVVVMDSDLQHPPLVIPLMVEKYEDGADIVYAVRNKARNLGLLKRLTSAAYYGLLRHLTSVNFVQGAADFRLMAAPVVATLREMRETHRYLRGMVPWLGYLHTIVLYDQPDRYAGVSNYTWRKMFRLARFGLFSFSTIPLDFITWFGVTITLLGMVYLVYIFIASLVLGIVIPGWTSTIMVVLIASGVQLVSVGVLAQYIGMIFEQVKGRPLYVLKQERIQTNPPLNVETSPEER